MKKNEKMETITINGKVWTKNNLSLTETRTGEKLILGKDYFYPDGNESNVEKYGLLYTWEAAMKVAPKGWHVPSKEEFESLINGDYVSYDKDGHRDLIPRNKIHEGFCPINAGTYTPHYRAYYEGYWYFNKNSYMWSSSEGSKEDKTWFENDEQDIRWFMYSEMENVMRMCIHGVLHGCSLRLVKD